MITTRLLTAHRRIAASENPTSTDWKEFQSAWNAAGNMPRIMVDGLAYGDTMAAYCGIHDTGFHGEEITDGVKRIGVAALAGGILGGIVGGPWGAAMGAALLGAGQSAYERNKTI